MLKVFFDGLSELTYPPHCLICEKHHITRTLTEILCPGCQTLIQQNTPPFCVKCSRPLGPGPGFPRCDTCLDIKPHFDFAWGTSLYNDPLRFLIHHFKYHQRTFLKHYFVSLMENFILAYNLDIGQFDLVLAMPLSAARQRERGFNQSEILALLICAKFQLHFAPGILIKSKHTPSQTALSQKERFTNIQGAFRIKQPLELRNKKILIIDDLLTTGSTASEAALTLKKGGAEMVGILTLAIAP